MKRKYGETQEERFKRMANEKAMGLPVRKRIGGDPGSVGLLTAWREKVKHTWSYLTHEFRINHKTWSRIK